VPPPGKWRAGFLYIDEVPLASGELSAELIAPPAPALPPGRFTARMPMPMAPPVTTARAALGTF
jgi:hypothetical protein